MSRCWGCCQENCGYRNCDCSCHSDEKPAVAESPKPITGDKPAGKDIRAVRIERKMTIHQLAKQLGVTAPRLSEVEHDRSRLSDQQYEALHKILNTRPRVSVRGCVGHGGDFDAAIADALRLLRDNGHCWSSWTVKSHRIEPYKHDGMTVSHWRHRHVVVLEITKGAKKT